MAGERIGWNFDQNSDQNKVFKTEICRSKESSNQEKMWVRANKERVVVIALLALHVALAGLVDRTCAIYIFAVD